MWVNYLMTSDEGILQLYFYNIFFKMRGDVLFACVHDTPHPQTYIVFRIAPYTQREEVHHNNQHTYTPWMGYCTVVCFRFGTPYIACSLIAQRE